MKDRGMESERRKAAARSVVQDRPVIVWHTRRPHNSGSLVATVATSRRAITWDRGGRAARFITTHRKSSVILLPPSNERRRATS